MRFTDDAMVAGGDGLATAVEERANLRASTCAGCFLRLEENFESAVKSVAAFVKHQLRFYRVALHLYIPINATPLC